MAPYEADAQLAHLFKSGHVDAVFTEDSDLLCFGVTRCFFKMDNLGNGQEVDLDDLKKVKCFKRFNHDMFMTACILSGCDYLDSIKGIGFKKAVKLVDEAGTDNTFHEVMTSIRDEGKLHIPKKYEKKYRKAYLTFKFQRIFCPKTMKLSHVEDPVESPHGSELKLQKTLDFLGKDMEPEVAQKIAFGDIDPVSGEPFPADQNELATVYKVLKHKLNKANGTTSFSSSGFTKHNFGGRNKADFWKQRNAQKKKEFRVRGKTEEEDQGDDEDAHKMKDVKVNVNNVKIPGTYGSKF